MQIDESFVHVLLFFCALRLPRISVPLPADAHASLLALMSKWKGAHILSVEQFDEPMLLELFGVAARLKRMVAASGDLPPTPTPSTKRHAIST